MQRSHLTVAYCAWLRLASGSCSLYPVKHIDIETCSSSFCLVWLACFRSVSKTQGKCIHFACVIRSFPDIKQLKREAEGHYYQTEPLTGLEMAALSHIISYLDFSLTRESNPHPPPPYTSRLPSMTKSHPTAREHSIAENVAAKRYLQRAAESLKQWTHRIQIRSM